MITMRLKKSEQQRESYFNQIEEMTELRLQKEQSSYNHIEEIKQREEQIIELENELTKVKSQVSALTESKKKDQQELTQLREAQNNELAN